MPPCVVRSWTCSSGVLGLDGASVLQLMQAAVSLARFSIPEVSHPKLRCAFEALSHQGVVNGRCELFRTVLQLLIRCDERGGKQHVVAALAIDCAPHRVADQTLCKGGGFDLCMYAGLWRKRLLRTAICHQLNAAE